MSSVATRISAQQIMGYCPHTSVSGDTWQYVKPGTTTSAGAAGGTTLIDTNGDSGGADTYNGRYWVRILSGALKGAWKRVVDDDGSGTLTFEGNGFEAQVAGSVQYEIWKSPEPVIVVTTSGGATDVQDTARTEGDAYWLDYWIVPITGNRRGEKAQVSQFTSSGGVYVVGSGFSGALAVGDVCLIRRFIEVGNFNDGTTETYEARRSVRTNFAEGDGVPGPRGGTCSFEADLVPSGSLVAADATARRSALGGLLVSCGFDETAGNSATIAAGSSTTAIKILTGKWEGFGIGMPVVWNGHLRWVTGLTDGGLNEDTVTVTPALPLEPAAAGVLYAGRVYSRSTTGDTYGCVIEYEADGVRTTMTGCKGNAVINDGAKVAVAFSFSVDHWIEEVEAAPYNPGTAYTTGKPCLSQDRHVWIDTTATDIGGFTASLNAEHAPKNVQGSNGLNGRAGYHLTGQAAGCTFRELLTSSGDTLPQQLKWTARTSFGVIVNWGSHGDAAGVRIPTARLKERAKRGDDGGLQAVTSVVQAQDAGTATNGASAVIKIPDFAIGIM